MRTTAEKVLSIAFAEVGYQEQPVNLTKYGEWYGLNGHQWCGMFANWVVEKAGGGKPGKFIPNTFYTPLGAQGFAKKKQLFTTGDMVAGDVAYFDFPNDSEDRISHVGFFVCPSKRKGYSLFISGNTGSKDPRNGGSVQVSEWPNKFVKAWGRPAYRKSDTSLIVDTVKAYFNSLK